MLVRGRLLWRLIAASASMAVAAFMPSPAAARTIADPFCRAFLVKDPPNLVWLPPPWFRPIVGGTVRFPNCIGSALAKATTRRTGKVCVQVLEPGRRGTWRSLSCRERTFRTRAYGAYDISVAEKCLRDRHRYRMFARLTIQRGPLIDTDTARSRAKFFSC